MKTVLMAAITIVFVVSLASVGTYAGFVDTETSAGNFVQAGSMDLILENPQGVGETQGHSVLRTWHWQNMDPARLMEPGDVLTSQVYLKAFSSSESDHVDINCVNVNSELDELDGDAEHGNESAILGYDVPREPNNGIYDKDTVMIITHMSYHMTPIIISEYDFDDYFITDTSGDGRISLAELAAQGLHGLTPVPDSGILGFFMTIKFATHTLRNSAWVEVGNEYQGDATNMTLIFNLTQ